jgi:hypothetical protein
VSPASLLPLVEDAPEEFPAVALALWALLAVNLWVAIGAGASWRLRREGFPARFGLSLLMSLGIAASALRAVEAQLLSPDHWLLTGAIAPGFLFVMPLLASVLHARSGYRPGVAVVRLGSWPTGRTADIVDALGNRARELGFGELDARTVRHDFAARARIRGEDQPLAKATVMIFGDVIRRGSDVDVTVTVDILVMVLQDTWETARALSTANSMAEALTREPFGGERLIRTPSGNWAPPAEIGARP